MKVFLPQFFYSYPNSNKNSSARPTSRINSLNKTHKSFFTARSSSPANTSLPQKTLPRRSKSMMKTQNEQESCILIPENDKKSMKQSLKQFRRNLSNNKSEVLKKLNSIYSQNKVYYMNFKELPLEIEPELQQLQKHNNNREQLIHYRKNTKNITRNLIEFRKNSESKIEKKKEGQIGNGSFLMTKKIRSSPQKNRSKSKIRMMKTEAVRVDKMELKNVRSSGKKIVPLSQPLEYIYPDCSPWSPSKHDHQLDFIFPA